MANRAYLYSLSNRPATYADRPESISGLSEWAYGIPFSYRLLISGEPQLCASLISDGLANDEDENEPGSKVRLYAISSLFEPGFNRLEKFFAIVRHLIQTPLAKPVKPPPLPSTGLLGRLFGRSQPSVSAPPANQPQITHLLKNLDESLAFLRAHRNQYLLLETVELDIMSESKEDALRACVEAELARCQQAGAALDALPADLTAAAARLREAVAQPLDAFHGLRLDDDCDNLRNSKTEYPLGLFWNEVLYFTLANKAEFKAH
jgi:hypothetical protein